MKKNIAVSSVFFLFLLGGALLLAHPHFRKVITATLPGGQQVTITYDTLPVNEEHTTKAAVGEFLIPGHNPRISFSAEVKAGSVTIPAGEFFIGALKNSDKDWTMGLYPGPLARGAKPDLAKVIKLDSVFLTSEGKAEHMLIDLQPGTEKLQNRAMLTIRFGSLFLGGALS